MEFSEFLWNFQIVTFLNLQIFEDFFHIDGPYAALFKLFLFNKKVFP